jgi:hypothetical protein
MGTLIKSTREAKWFFIAALCINSHVVSRHLQAKPQIPPTQISVAPPMHSAASKPIQNPAPLPEREVIVGSCTFPNEYVRDLAYLHASVEAYRKGVAEADTPNDHFVKFHIRRLRVLVDKSPSISEQLAKEIKAALSDAESALAGH